MYVSAKLKFAFLAALGVSAIIAMLTPAMSSQQKALSSQPEILSVQTKALFPDTDGHWASKAIDALAKRKIIKGFPSGNYRPDAPVKRGEFAAIVYKAFGSRPYRATAREFPDDNGHWAENVIREATKLGFIRGYQDGTFRPEGNIRRVEAVVSLSSGLDLQGISSLSQYSDRNKIPTWARRQVQAATQHNIKVEGPDSNQFLPNQLASRADIATFVYQALKTQPEAARITYLGNVGGPPRLFRKGMGQLAQVDDELSDRSHELRIPARSQSNMKFRPSLGGGTIMDYLVQAGDRWSASTYSYPCDGKQGSFVIGWTRGTKQGCPTLRIGVPFVLPTAGLEDIFMPVATKQLVQVSQAATVLISPVSEDETSWIQVQSTKGKLVITVLSGRMDVTLEDTTRNALVVKALERYTLQLNDRGNIQRQTQRRLTSEERKAIASSPEIQSFLDPTHWSRDVVPQLNEYQIALKEFIDTSAQPDLTVGLVGPSVGRAGTDIGGAIQLTVRNLGNATAPGTVGNLNPDSGFMIDLVLSSDQSVPPGLANFSPGYTEDVLLRGGRISRTEDISANTSRNYPAEGSAILPANIPAGAYWLCARIDPGNVVVELNEQNNVSCSPIRIP